MGRIIGIGIWLLGAGVAVAGARLGAWSVLTVGGIAMMCGAILYDIDLTDPDSLTPDEAVDSALDATNAAAVTATAEADGGATPAEAAADAASAAGDIEHGHEHEHEHGHGDGHGN